MPNSSHARTASIVVLLASAFGCAQPRAATQATAVAPTDITDATVEYSWLLDQGCALRAGITLDSSLIKHVNEVLPAYRAEWANRGPELLRAETAVLGRGYGFHEVRAAIITCGINSMSFPVVLNAGSFRRATSPADEMTVFVNTLWHEITHRQIDETIKSLPGATTPLLTKYAAELPVVQNHLHLYAVQELVYRRLGRSAEVQTAIGVERQLRNGMIFERAHQIVANEGAEAFVRELVAAKR